MVPTDKPANIPKGRQQSWDNVAKADIQSEKWPLAFITEGPRVTARVSPIAEGSGAKWGGGGVSGGRVNRWLV